MSCYVISKGEYAKVAGWVSGVSDSEGYRNPLIWVWDKELGATLESYDWLDKFMWVYDMNIKSVAESWEEDEEKIKHCMNDDVKDIFRKYRGIGKKDYQNWVGDFEHNTRFEDGVREYIGFTNSVLYQIENDEIAEKVKSFMNDVGMKLSEKVVGKSNEWGVFKIGD